MREAHFFVGGKQIRFSCEGSEFKSKRVDQVTQFLWTISKTWLKTSPDQRILVYPFKKNQAQKMKLFFHLVMLDSCSDSQFLIENKTRMF